MLHKLNHCGTAEAAVYRQGLGPFFLDSPFRYEAAFLPLAPTLAAQLRPLLQDNARGTQLHAPRYSMLAYPWATRYQQSNQWAIETLAIAAAGAADRSQAQAWLQAQGYQPTVLQLGPLTRPGRPRHPRQCRLRRPSERAALCRPHRHGDGGFGLRLAAAHRPGRRRGHGALTHPAPHQRTTLRPPALPERP